MIVFNSNIDDYSLTVTPTSSIDSISSLGSTKVVFVKDMVTYSYAATATNYERLTGTVAVGGNDVYAVNLVMFKPASAADEFNKVWFQDLPQFSTFSNGTENVISTSEIYSLICFARKGVNAIYFAGRAIRNTDSSIFRYDLTTQTKTNLGNLYHAQTAYIKPVYDQENDVFGVLKKLHKNNAIVPAHEIVTFQRYDFNTNTFSTENICFTNTTDASSNFSLSSGGYKNKFYFSTGISSESGRGKSWDCVTNTLSDITPYMGDINTNVLSYLSIKGVFWNNKWVFFKNANLWIYDINNGYTESQYTNFPPYVSDNNPDLFAVEFRELGLVTENLLLHFPLMRQRNSSFYTFNPSVFDLSKLATRTVANFLVGARRNSGGVGYSYFLVCEGYLYDIYYIMNPANGETKIRRIKLSDFI